MLPFKMIKKRAWNHFVVKPKYFWLFIGGLLISLIPFLFYYLSPNSELFFRISGFILQLFFVRVVWKGIVEVQKEYGKSTILDSILKWFKDILTIFTKERVNADLKPSNVKVGITDTGASIKARLKADANLEERINFLENRYAELEKSTSKRFRKVDKKFKNITESVKQEKKIWEENIEEMSELLERISTHGLKREFMGLSWLVIGLLFSIFPSELTCILNLIS